MEEILKEVAALSEKLKEMDIAHNFQIVVLEEKIGTKVNREIQNHGWISGARLAACMMSIISVLPEVGLEEVGAALAERLKQLEVDSDDQTVQTR